MIIHVSSIIISSNIRRGNFKGWFSLTGVCLLLKKTLQFPMENKTGLAPIRCSKTVSNLGGHAGTIRNLD
jgi:hypothetical protein